MRNSTIIVQNLHNSCAKHDRKPPPRRRLAGALTRRVESGDTGKAVSLVRPGSRATAAIVASVVAVTLQACASANRQPVSLRLPGLAAKPVLRLSWIDNYPRALATIAYILEHDLRLPQVEASLRFYGSREALTDALIESGYDPGTAVELTGSAGALAADGNIILNEKALLGRTWTQRIAVLAHELTHSVQYQLADGRRGASEQWLREGFSEWVAVRVLERLDVTTLPRIRHLRLRHVRDEPALPSLSSLARSEQWLAPVRQRADAAMYPYAFLAVDFLVQLHGTEKVVEYFRLFAFTDDRDWAFRTTFGQDVGSFERRLRTRIRPGTDVALHRR